MIIFLIVILIVVTKIKKGRVSSLPEAQNLLAAIIVQGAIGYLQYFTDVPALLVGVHVAGATLIWVLTLKLRLSLLLPINREPVKEIKPVSQ